MNFWDFIVYSFWIFAWIAYLMVLFSIIADIFRDHTLNGWLKAVWIIFLVFVPFITALVYLIARGPSMTRRKMGDIQRAQSDTDSYIRTVASTNSPAEEISKAKTLLDSGAITPAEFETIKAHTLASS
ncbi:SHOCT domain-containing protein [Leifsonia poae]|uniref:Membrane protein n=1 Tax=Leifsonia poae TaxID=110933 RepID=A0A9W6LZF3_9MICO|nr:SHOCT domain-containing protein [Leifsonia poae]GLJ76183.1 membrane protein [Leifsonia poae]